MATHNIYEQSVAKLPIVTDPLQGIKVTQISKTVEKLILEYEVNEGMVSPELAEFFFNDPNENLNLRDAMKVYINTLDDLLHAAIDEDLAITFIIKGNKGTTGTVNLTVQQAKRLK